MHHLRSLSRLRERAGGEGGETHRKEFSSIKPIGLCFSTLSLASPASGRGVVELCNNAFKKWVLSFAALSFRAASGPDSVQG